MGGLPEGDARRGHRLRAIAVFACVLALGVVVVARAWPTTREIARALPERNASAYDHATAGGRLAGVRTDFVEWARQRLGSHRSYWLSPAGARSDVAVFQWVTYRLLPHDLASDPAHADALIWYGGGPVPRPPPHFGRIQQYAPGFAVTLRRTD
jgi:hypothetical protein